MLLSWVLSVMFLVMGLSRLVSLSSVKGRERAKFAQEYHSRVEAVSSYLMLSVLMAFIGLMSM